MRLSSNLGQFNFASASLYDVPGRIIRKALFWTISIFFDRYFGRLAISLAPFKPLKPCLHGTIVVFKLCFCHKNDYVPKKL